MLFRVQARVNLFYQHSCYSDLEMLALRSLRNLVGGFFCQPSISSSYGFATDADKEDGKKANNKKDVKLFELQKKKNWDEYFQGLPMPYNESSFKALQQV